MYVLCPSNQVHDWVKIPPSDSEKEMKNRMQKRNERGKTTSRDHSNETEGISWTRMPGSVGAGSWPNTKLYRPANYETLLVVHKGPGLASFSEACMRLFWTKWFQPAHCQEIHVGRWTGFCRIGFVSDAETSSQIFIRHWGVVRGRVVSQRF